MSQNHSEQENEVIDQIIKKITGVPSEIASRYSPKKYGKSTILMMNNMTEKKRVEFVNQVVQEAATTIGSAYIPVVIIAGTPGTTETIAAMSLLHQEAATPDDEKGTLATSALTSFLQALIGMYFKSGGDIASLFEIISTIAEEEAS